MGELEEHQTEPLPTTQAEWEHKQTEPLPTTQAEWEHKLSQLRATNAELQRRKADAEKDRDFFRDLYSKASAHAGEVSKENDALLERAELAEGQARDGLAMVRAMYDARVRRVEEEAARWKAQYALLAGRDSRMDDYVRSRAALEPELRAEVGTLRDKLEALEEDYARLEGLLEGMTKEQVEKTAELAETARAPVDSAVVLGS